MIASAHGCTRCPQAHLNKHPIEGAYSWNVKPYALLNLFERGHADALWIDADVIITRDFQGRFADLGPDTLCVAEDALQSGNRLDNNPPRAVSWGFAVGRSLPFAANTAILRVTRFHIPLLNRWGELLASGPYKAAQDRKTGRPGHMFGDQDVLSALLASQEFSHIPLKFLNRGRDIVQYFTYHGYTCAERLGHLLHGLPPFIHSQVNKPWVPGERQKPPFEFTRRFWIKWLTCIYLDASPYKLLAEKYRSLVGDDTSWMQACTLPGRILRVLGFGYMPLVGLPIAIYADLIRARKRLVSR